MPELWEEIASELDLPYRYHLEDMPGLLRGLKQGRYQVALGAITITPEREVQVDFSHAVNPSGTGIAVAAGTFRESFNAYWKPILFSLLGLLLSITVLLVSAGFFIWLIERRHNPDHFEMGWRGILDGLWWSAVTMATVGYGDKVPRSLAGRILAMTWIFISIVLIALFTANASSIFLNTEKESAINHREDLYGIRVGSVARSSGAEYLRRHHIPFADYTDVLSALHALENRELDAVVYNTPTLQYYQNQHFPRSIRISRRELMKNHMGIALTPGMPEKEAINRVLLQKLTEPEWQSLCFRYFGEEE